MFNKKTPSTLNAFAANWCVLSDIYPVLLIDFLLIREKMQIICYRYKPVVIFYWWFEFCLLKKAGIFTIENSIHEGSEDFLQILRYCHCATWLEYQLEYVGKKLTSCWKNYSNFATSLKLTWPWNKSVNTQYSVSRISEID